MCGWLIISPFVSEVEDSPDRQLTKWIEQLFERYSWYMCLTDFDNLNTAESMSCHIKHKKNSKYRLQQTTHIAISVFLPSLVNKH
jgi:hypothetical protein